MTIEDVQVKLAEARAAYKAAGDKVDRYYNLIKKLEADRAKVTPMGISEALVTYLPSGVENTPGFEWLEAFFGALSCGISRCGYNPSTNQYAFNLRVNRRADDAFVERMAMYLDGLLTVIKPHAEVKDRRHSVMVGYQLFEVMTPDLSASGVVQAAHKDGKWTIFKTTYGTTRKIKADIPTTLDMVKLLRVQCGMREWGDTDDYEAGSGIYDGDD